MLYPCIHFLSNRTIGYGDIGLKFYCNVLLCHFKVIADRQTHTHTEKHTATQPQHNSFATALRLAQLTHSKKVLVRRYQINIICLLLKHIYRLFIKSKSTSWRQMYDMTSKSTYDAQKYVMASKVRHDVKEYSRTSKSRSWCRIDLVSVVAFLTFLHSI